MHRTLPMFQSILMIDGSDIDLFVQCRIIELAGVAEQVVTMNSPLRALEYLKSIQGGYSVNTKPDLVLLEINMPFMNGFEFLDQLERIYSGHKTMPTVAILTSTMDRDYMAKASGYQAVINYLHKPLTEVALHALLDQAYEQNGMHYNVKVA